MFQSVALVDRASRPETICLLRVEDLSEDTLERFNHLFTIREKWTEEDITPYIQYVSSIQDISAVLDARTLQGTLQEVNPKVLSLAI